MRRIDVGAILDGAAISGLPLIVMVSTTFVLVLDGLDIQIISLAAPVLRGEFLISSAALGPVFAAGLIGMAFGNFLTGSLGDRWGRRPTLLASVALFAFSTLICATTHHVTSLAGWRFFTGIGLGGAIPNGIALLAEFARPKWRNYAVAVAVIGVPVGGMTGAALAAYVIPSMGWRTMFIIGGLLPCATLVALFFLLPESPRYLVTQPNRRQSLLAVLHRLSPAENYSLGDQFELAESDQGVRNGDIKAILKKSLLRDTCGLWLIFATNMFSTYTFFSWLPVILNSVGLPLSLAIRGSVVFNLAGVCGGLCIAWVLSRTGSRWPTAALAGLCIVALCVISRLLNAAKLAGHLPSAPKLLGTIAIVGFAMIGIQTVAYMLSTHLYPTQLRSTGVGWAAGFGRLGGIFSSLIAGWLLAQFQGAGLFAILTGVVLLTLLGVLVIQRHLSSTPNNVIKRT